jgi:hypothetical protein
MIRFTLEPDAGPKLAGYMEHVRARIVSAIRGGMREAMQDLASYIVANKLSGNPIGQQAAPSRFTKPGDLAASIMAGVRVGGNEQEVYGTLSGRPKNQPNLGYWQEFGTSHPAVAGKLRVFAGADGQLVFTTSIAAFSIQPRPFLNPSLGEQKAQIMATIHARLSEANIS